MVVVLYLYHVTLACICFVVSVYTEQIETFWCVGGLVWNKSIIPSSIVGGIIDVLSYSEVRCLVVVASGVVV